MTNNINGAGGDDFFNFTGTTATTSLNGTLNGGTGTDTLNYIAFADNVVVNLAEGTATAVNGGTVLNPVSNVENFIGTLVGTNTIYGDDNDNILVGAPAMTA